METLSTKSPEANDSGQPSTDWEEVAAMTGTQQSTDWEEVAAMADTQIKQTETKAQSAQDDPETKNKNEENVENDIRIIKDGEKWSDRGFEARRKLVNDITRFLRDNSDFMIDYENQIHDPFISFEGDYWTRVETLKKIIDDDLFWGKGYKDIKRLVKISTDEKEKFSDSPKLQEDLANLITRIIAVDANHGASPLQRIKHKISKK